jgi:hypothetical protein
MTASVDGSKSPLARSAVVNGDDRHAQSMFQWRQEIT